VLRELLQLPASPTSAASAQIFSLRDRAR
jgi:hypothetical protein